MMPSIRAGSPAPFARMFCFSSPCVRRPATDGSVPIWMKGPAVWERVSFRESPAISVSFAPVLEESGAVATEHDVEAVRHAVERYHAGHVQPADQAVDSRLVRDSVDDRTARNQRIALEVQLRH